MQVRVLLFATYRDLAGIDQLRVELPAGATARDLVDVLRRRPDLQRLPPDPALAVNQEYAAPSTSLSDDDEVALLPPVAGG
jgi:molybdopterin converting factor subunit 1